MRDLPVRAAEPDASAILATVGRTFAHCATLADLLGWAARQVPRVAVSEIVTQDEYTHDVVLPFGEHYLSFDTTWLGSITAVAVWQHQPSADELLEDRLRRGWKATPSMLRDGDRVLGHASCAVDRQLGQSWTDLLLNGEPHGDGDHAAPAEDDLSEQAFDPRIELAEWLHGELVREYAGETESWATERVARVMARLNAERADAEPKEAVILLLRERRERVVAYLRKQQAENASRGTG